MSETDALLRLQEVDLELLRRRTALAKLPQLAQIQKIRSAAKKLVGELNHVVGVRKDLELELGDNEFYKEQAEDQVTATQEQVAEVGSDYRALKDLETSLSNLAKRLEKLDFERKGLLQKLEEARAQEAQVKQVAARLQAELKTQVDSFKVASEEINEIIDKLEFEREGLAAQISPELQLRYQAAQERFGGLAVETLQGNKGSICRVTLQPSSYHDLMAQRTGITECPYCHRILVVGPQSSENLLLGFKDSKRSLRGQTSTQCFEGKAYVCSSFSTRPPARAAVHNWRRCCVQKLRGFARVAKSGLRGACMRYRGRP